VCVGALLVDLCIRLEASANKLPVGELKDEKDRFEVVKKFPEQVHDYFFGFSIVLLT
jgi:hypothetical protein